MRIGVGPRGKKISNQEGKEKKKKKKRGRKKKGNKRGEGILEVRLESNRSYDLFRDSPGEQWKKPLKRQSGSPPGE